MTFYESIANQGTQTLKAVRVFIETSGECAMFFDQEARCVTDTTVASQLFGEEGAQMLKKCILFICKIF